MHRLLSIKPKNSLSGDTKILLHNGHYKPIRHIRIGDKVIGKDGKPVQVRNVKCMGKCKVKEIHHELWHEPTLMSYDQGIQDIQSSKDSKASEYLILPNNIEFEQNENKPSYEDGFIYSIIFLSSVIIKNNVLAFVQKKGSGIKKLNYYLSKILGIQNVDMYEGSYFIMYEIHHTFDLRSSITLNTHKDYLEGIKDGSKIVYKIGSYNEEQNMFNNFINISYPTHTPKLSKYYCIKYDNKFIEMWDLKVDDNIFIANNISCVSI